MKFDNFIGSRKGLVLAIFIPTIACLFFPTINSTQDGMGYAADALWGVDLFHPHHLLYTAQLFLFSKVLPYYDVLLLGKHLNALYVGFSLFIFQLLLSLYNHDKVKVNVLTFFVGVSFAILRFGTENETYIAPIFYSLVGNYFFAKFYKNKNIAHLALSGFFLAFACLIHQVQFFWWLTILTFLLFNSKPDFKKVLVFFLPSLIVPLAYILVLVLYRNESLSFANLFHFVFETFYTGSSGFKFDFKGVARFLIAIFRCFIQIHGFIYSACKAYPVLYALAGTILLPMLYFILQFLKSLKSNHTLHQHFKLYAFLLGAQLGFGLFCYGNSEMMVTIPFIVAIVLVIQFHFSVRMLFLLSLLILGWNLSFGLILNNQLNFNTHQYWAEKSQKQKDLVFFLRYGTEINCYIYYQTGKYKTNCIASKCQNTTAIKMKIDSLLKSYVNVYTDCLKSGIIKILLPLYLITIVNYFLKTIIQ